MTLRRYTVSEARQMRALFLRVGLSTLPSIHGGRRLAMAMDTGKLKEEFQYAYVAALAAHAGLNRGDFRVDNDSVDVTFQGKGYQGQIRNPQIQLQLKCTSRHLVSGGVIKFPLPKKNYDDLRGDNVVVPRYLAVLMVPEEIGQWVMHHDDCVALHNLCFWVSLREAPASTNADSVTVDIPLSQRLTTDALRDMMKAASNGRSM